MHIVGEKRKFYIETYGCQMNVSDSEIVASILSGSGMNQTADIENADILMVNTCAIRQNAEDKVYHRLQHFKALKKKRKDLIIGLIGCMAGANKNDLLEKEPGLDFIAGPDAYRNLPALIETVYGGSRAFHTLLSAEETYADIPPVRYDSNGITAFISIMRGCENFCAYCVVPYARGTERSRDPLSIINEAGLLYRDGYREVTLLGQNVNSYRSADTDGVIDFPVLLGKIAGLHPGMRLRFATSHPKDLNEKLIQTIAQFPNICKAIHLPVQSGSDRVLERMNRKYSRGDYLEKVGMIRRLLPDVSISTDLITGFCDESEEDHQQTLSLMKLAEFDAAFTFKYSERPDTPAAKKYTDNVRADVKEKRLKEIIHLQHDLSLSNNQKEIGRIREVLVEGRSKRSDKQYFGRTSQNKVVVFPASQTFVGQMVQVKISRVTSATLIGSMVRS